MSINRSICDTCSMSACQRMHIPTWISPDLSRPVELLLYAHLPEWSDNALEAPLSGSNVQFMWNLLAEIGVNYGVGYTQKCLAAGRSSDVCKNQFWSEIEEYKPKCVLFLGKDAVESIFGEEAAYKDMSEYAYHTDKAPGVAFLATVDPRRIVDFTTKGRVYAQFMDDLVYACRHATAYRTTPLYKSKTINAQQFHRIVDVLLADPSIEYIGFDTESNGLDPMLENILITSFSFSWDRKIGYNVFLWHPELINSITDEDRLSIIADAKRLLTQKKIVAHHAKHEHRMIKVCWGFTPNITDDTMYMSYILYLSYPGISHGLKYLSGRFVNLPPWEEILYRFVDMFKRLAKKKKLDDDDIDGYVREMSDVAQIDRNDILRFYDIITDPYYPIAIQGESRDSDPRYWLVPAKIMEAYAGMDAVAPLLLMDKFLPAIQADKGLNRCYRMLVEAAEAFANIELYGIRMSGIDNWKKIYTQKIDEAWEYICNTKEARDIGRETGVPFEGKQAQLQDLMFKRMKFDVVSVTEKGGKPQINDEFMIENIKKLEAQSEVLEDGDPIKEECDRKAHFLRVFREYKKLQKIQTGYWDPLGSTADFNRPGRCFDGFRCQWVDMQGDYNSNGKADSIHPSYGLSATDSVTFDTLVMTENGEVPIIDLCAEDVDPLQGSHYCVCKDVAVFDGDTYRTPLAFWYGGLREVLKVFFESGNSVICTPEHPLLAERDGERLWIQSRHVLPQEKLCKADGSYEIVDHVEYLDEEMEVCDLVMDPPDVEDDYDWVQPI